MLTDDGGDGCYNVEDNEAKSAEDHSDRGGYEVSVRKLLREMLLTKRAEGRS